MMRYLLSALALVIATPAFAGPISITAINWRHYTTVHGRFVATEPRSLDQYFWHDPVTNNRSETVADYYGPTMFGRSRAATVLSVDETDDSTAWELRSTVEAMGSVSSTADEGAFIYVDASVNPWWFEFEVLEAVRYTAVGFESSNFFGNPENIGDLTGGILQPGSYTARMQESYVSLGQLFRGETDYARVESLAAFTAVAVPEPATMVLLGAGFLGVVVLRCGRRALQ